jgi:hypothetical protein
MQSLQQSRCCAAAPLQLLLRCFAAAPLSARTAALLLLCTYCTAAAVCAVAMAHLGALEGHLSQLRLHLAVEARVEQHHGGDKTLWAGLDGPPVWQGVCRPWPAAWAPEPAARIMEGGPPPEGRGVGGRRNYQHLLTAGAPAVTCSQRSRVGMVSTTIAGPS